MGPLLAANLVLRFVLELTALVAFAVWGLQAGDAAPAHLVLGVGLPLAVATAWGLVVSPRARIDRGPVVRVVVEVALLGGAVLALAAAGHATLATVYGVLVVVHLALFHLADPTATSRPRGVG